MDVAQPLKRRGVDHLPLGVFVVDEYMYGVTYLVMELGHERRVNQTALAEWR